MAYVFLYIHYIFSQLKKPGKKPSFYDNFERKYASIKESKSPSITA